LAVLAAELFPAIIILIIEVPADTLAVEYVAVALTAVINTFDTYTGPTPIKFVVALLVKGRPVI
jgi:hypothetical protein